MKGREELLLLRERIISGEDVGYIYSNYIVPVAKVSNIKEGVIVDMFVHNIDELLKVDFEEEILTNILRNLIIRSTEENNLLKSVFVSLLVWVLELENDKKRWVWWQDFYCSHASGGADTCLSEFIVENVGKDKVVLDVGVHNGFMTNLLSKDNRIVGIDLPLTIGRFKEEYKFVCLAMNAEDGFPFIECYFDVVLCGNLLEHILDLKKFLLDVRRVLKVGGLLIAVFPSHESLFIDPVHNGDLSGESVMSLMDGFEIVKHFSRGNVHRPSTVILGKKK